MEKRKRTSSVELDGSGVGFVESEDEVLDGGFS